MSTGWEFFLARSSDMAILSRITNATNKSLNPIFNQKGSFSCTVKIDSAAALLVDKWEHCIIVQRPNGTEAWSGPVVGIVDSANEGTTTLTAQGWQSELDYRWIRTVAELQEAIAYATPAPVADNPTFASDTTSWTAGSSTITRDTGTYNTSPASGRWDNNGSLGVLGAADTLTETFTGMFFAGVSYKLDISIRANSLSSADVLFAFGDVSGGNYASTQPAIGASFATVSVTWVPTSNCTTATLVLSTLGGRYYWIDSLAITDSYHSTIPTVDNPSFSTNTTGWTATNSSITRDTSVYDTGTASGRWDNGASNNLDITDSLEGAITGTFLAGVAYKCTFKFRGSAVNRGRYPQPLSIVFGNGSDVAATTRGVVNGWLEGSVTWTPTTSVSSAFLRFIIVLGGFYLWIDSVSITQVGGVPQDTTFTDIDDGMIAEALVRLANRQTDSGGTTRATHLTPNGTSTTPRTRTYQVGQNIGAAIRELSEVENGFDIEVDPATRDIDFIPNTSYTDQTDIAYGYNALPRNLDDVIVNDDGTTKANSINVQAAFTIGNADSPSDIAATGVLLEDWLSAADIKDIEIVGAYANEELVFRVGGQMTIAAKPLPGAPMPYIDYDWGDKVYISANKGRMQLDRQAARVFSGRISWNSQNEAVLDELGLTP